MLMSMLILHRLFKEWGFVRITSRVIRLASYAPYSP